MHTDEISSDTWSKCTDAVESRSLGQSLYDFLSETELAIIQEGFAERTVQTAKNDLELFESDEASLLTAWCTHRVACVRSAGCPALSWEQQQLTRAFWLSAPRHSFRCFIEILHDVTQVSVGV